jgi:hypothetical protein
MVKIWAEAIAIAVLTPACTFVLLVLVLVLAPLGAAAWIGAKGFEFASEIVSPREENEHRNGATCFHQTAGKGVGASSRG